MWLHFNTLPKFVTQHPLDTTPLPRTTPSDLIRLYRTCEHWKVATQPWSIIRVPFIDIIMATSHLEHTLMSLLKGGQLPSRPLNQPVQVVDYFTHDNFILGETKYIREWCIAASNLLVYIKDSGYQEHIIDSITTHIQAQTTLLLTLVGKSKTD